MALKDLWRRLTRLDRIIVVAMILLAFGLMTVVGSHVPGETVVVSRDGEIIFRAPLADARLVELQGPLGTTVLEISNGHAAVTSSPCRFKVCIGMGAIARTGALIACVPNRILVQINGTDSRRKEGGYDLLSR